MAYQTLVNQHYLMQLQRRVPWQQTIRSQTIDPNVGIVEVPDARLLKLEEMVQPKKHYLLHLNLQILPELLKVLLKVKV